VLLIGSCYSLTKEPYSKVLPNFITFWFTSLGITFQITPSMYNTVCSLFTLKHKYFWVNFVDLSMK